MADPENVPQKNQRVQRIATRLTVAFAAFLLGFLPMWLTARMHERERDAAQRALSRATIEHALAAAAVHAGRGDYEAAHRMVSDFYAALLREVGRADQVPPGASGDALRRLLAQREELMALVARRDATAARRLADSYVDYQRASAIVPRSATGHTPARRRRRRTRPTPGDAGPGCRVIA